MFLVVYDVTSESSFKAAEGWARRLRDLGLKTKCALGERCSVDSMVV